MLWDLFTETFSFALAWREIVEYAGLGAWAILAVTCYAHLTAIGPRHMNVVMGLVLALIVSGATMQLVTKSETRELMGQRASLGDLRPPAFRMVPPASAEAFFKEADETRTRVDDARKREPPAAGGFSDLD